jgi:RimJ/RimL family protein N-acetyltransferase
VPALPGLRDPRAADARAYVQAFADDPGLARMLGFPAPDEAEARRLFRRERRDRARGRAVRLVISSDGAAFEGLVLLHTFEWTHRRAECGLMVVPAARRRGLALAAVRELVAWALGAVGLQRIGLATLEENVATQRLAERAGFTREGLLRAYTREFDRPVDNLVYSVLP